MKPALYLTGLLSATGYCERGTLPLGWYIVIAAVLLVLLWKGMDDK